MPQSSGPAAALSDTARAESWAEVRAHDRVMRYYRCGTGPVTLIVLVSSDHPKPLWPELLEELCSGFRVIVPEPPAAGADVAAWLGDFLEGLGAWNVAVLAADHYCVPVVELAFFGLDQIARVVMVTEGREARDEGRGTLEPGRRQAVIPLLLVRRGQPADEAVPLVTQFLRGETAAVA